MIPPLKSCFWTVNVTSSHARTCFHCTIEPQLTTRPRWAAPHIEHVGEVNPRVTPQIDALCACKTMASIHTSSHLTRWCIFSSTYIFIDTYLPYWALIPKYTLVISLSYVGSVDDFLTTPRICFGFIFTDCANMVSSVSIILLLIFILSSSPYATSPCAILPNT